MIPPPPFPEDVDVAVVSHDGRETLPRVLACLDAAGAPHDRITVYDVASTDGTGSWLSEAWPRVRVLRLEENRGPNPARNLALRDRRRPYLLLLDFDAYLRPDAPSRLRRALDAPRAGMATPVTINPPDRIQYASVSLHFLCEAINRYAGEPIEARGTAIRAVGTAPAVALLIDVNAAHRVGLWDERYFLGKDDGDFSFRMRLAGYEIVEDPSAVAEHPQKPRSTWLFRHQIRNRWHFLLRNYQLRTLIVLFPALAVHEVVQLGVLAGRGHLRAWWEALTELRSWLGTLRGERRELRKIRVVGDRDLLEFGPLMVRPDLMGGGVGQAAKRAYDGWLRAYWAVARRLLS